MPASMAVVKAAGALSLEMGAEESRPLSSSPKSSPMEVSPYTCGSQWSPPWSPVTPMVNPRTPTAVRLPAGSPTARCNFQGYMNASPLGLRSPVTAVQSSPARTGGPVFQVGLMHAPQSPGAIIRQNAADLGIPLNMHPIAGEVSAPVPVRSLHGAVAAPSPTRRAAPMQILTPAIPSLGAPPAAPCASQMPPLLRNVVTPLTVMRPQSAANSEK